MSVVGNSNKNDLRGLCEVLIGYYLIDFQVKSKNLYLVLYLSFCRHTCLSIYLSFYKNLISV
jgi:hypothetical protein